MPYEPTNWVNREVEKPRTFTMKNNADGTITLTPAEGQILVSGTPLVAENLNKIEQGIVSLENSIALAETGLQSDLTSLTGRIDSMDYTLATNTANITALQQKEIYFAYKNAYQGFTKNAFASIRFEAVRADLGNIVKQLDSFIFEIQKDGVYQINATLGVSDINYAKGFATLMINGTNLADTYLSSFHFAYANNVAIQGSAALEFFAGDKVYINLYTSETCNVIGFPDVIRTHVSFARLF